MNTSRTLRWLYCLNTLLLAAPVWFMCTTMNAPLPASWDAKTVGDFRVTITPLNDAPPYAHDDHYLKDISLQFCEGCGSRIRRAIVVASESAPAFDDILHGVVHGHGDLLHAHAYFPAGNHDLSLWLVTETWNGQQHAQRWPIPASWKTAP